MPRFTSGSEITMSLTQEHSTALFKEDEWQTKAEYKRRHPNLSYVAMTREVDRGKIAVKLDVDGKIKINVAQADDIFGFAPDLFA
jgi:ATP-dependent exoDNAse (exonuclease V) beta subunit